MDRRNFLKTSAASAAILLFDGVDGMTSEPSSRDFEFSAPILPIGVPTRNGNVYPRDVVEKMIADLHGASVPGSLGVPDNGIAKLGETSHVARNFRIHARWVHCDISVLETPEGQKLRDLIWQGREIVFRTAAQATAHVAKDGYITCCQESRPVLIVEPGLKLVGVHAVLKSEASC